MLELDPSTPIWDHFFSVAPLVVIGTRNENDEPNLAPKHMAGPMGWDNFFGFVCSPTHATLRNVLRRKRFSVSYPRADQVLLTALAASPCGAEVTKEEILSRLPLEGEDPVLADSMIHLNCELHQTVELGRNTLVLGQVVRARVHPDYLRHSDADDHDRLHRYPLLAYLSPGRYAIIHESEAFPFPRGYRR